MALHEVNRSSNRQDRPSPLPPGGPSLAESRVSEPGRGGPETPTGEQVALAGEGQAARAGRGGSPVDFGAWGGSGNGETAPDVSALGRADLASGARGEEVRALQRMLKERTGADLEVDGVFGRNTLAAVQRYQGAQGLEVDGVVGPDTRSALGRPAPGPSGGAAPPSRPSAPSPGRPEPARPPGIAAPDANPRETRAADGTRPAGETRQAGPSRVPGVDDTRWTENLPPGLRPHAQAFLDAGRRYGVDPRFLAAISMQETGGGTSSAIRNRNNAMGITGRNGVVRFRSVASSIESQARALTRPDGYYRGKTTIATIGQTYAPVGAANDPRGQNRHWVPNISRFYEALGGDPRGQVAGFEGS